MANFGLPGDESGEEPTWHLVPGSSGGVGEPDDEGDSTLVNWRLPEQI